MSVSSGFVVLRGISAFARRPNTWQAGKLSLRVLQGPVPDDAGRTRATVTA
jgi:hypothetical protein